MPAGTVMSPPVGGPLQVAIIQFGRSSSALGEEGSDVIARVAQIQRSNGGKVRIVGHAAQDVEGSSVSQIEDGNMRISVARARSVASLLVRDGVPASAIVIEGESDENPAYETRTARGLAANRRAEVYLDF